jgi:phytanoyl-CoA hydroxylase
MAGLGGFRRDGYVVLRGAIDAGFLDDVIAHVEPHVDMLAETDVAASAPFERRLLQVLAGRALPARHFDPLLHSEPVCGLLQCPGLTDALAQVLGPNITYQGNGHLRAHLPGPLDPVPWHQDVQFYGAGTELMAGCMAQVWLPLVDAGEDRGCLAVVAGSHTWGLLPGAVSGQTNITPSTADQQERIYRTNAARAAAAEVTLLPMRKGDFAMFHPLLLHTGTENRSDRVRWSIDVRFEATIGTRPLTDEERTGYATMHRRLRGRGYVPLRVRVSDGPGEDWATWQRRAAQTTAAGVSP